MRPQNKPEPNPTRYNSMNHGPQHQHWFDKRREHKLIRASVRLELRDTTRTTT